MYSNLKLYSLMKKSPNLFLLENAPSILHQVYLKTQYHDIKHSKISQQSLDASLEYVYRFKKQD